jgi:hypothetical protein
MNVSQAGIFQHSGTQAVRETFESALAEGLSVAAATEQVLEDFEGDLSAPDGGAVVLLALVALQLEHDSLQLQLRNRALAIIEDLHRQEVPAFDGLDASVLQDLAGRLKRS